VAQLSRKELKKDEVRETLAHGAEAVLSHQQLTLYLLIVILVGVLSFYGWRAYAGRQASGSGAAFDAAMKIFQAPVGTPPAPGAVTYSDDSKKYAAAEASFSALASKYPRTRAGQLGRYYRALSLEKLNKDDQARNALQNLVNTKDPDVAAMAKLELAGLDDRTGQGDEAAKLYQQLIDKPSILAPKPVAMLGLANHYRDKDPSRAATIYSQIKSDYPDTPIAEQADQALALLPGKS
jgi:hypothetical protein